MLIAFYLDRAEPRNFLLRRIVSDVDIQDISFEPAQNGEVAMALNELENHKNSQKAVIKVSPSSAAWFHFDLAPEEVEFETSYMDLFLFAEELMEFVDEIEIVSPVELADLVRENLFKVKKAHA